MTYQNDIETRPVRATPWPDWVNMLLAIWLFISPWVLEFGSGVSTAAPAGGAQAVGAVSNAAWNAWVLGVIVFLVAISALGRLGARHEWINLVLGAWIFAAPWALGFAYGHLAAAAWDHWIVGALIFLISAWALGASRPARVRPGGDVGHGELSHHHR